MRGEILKGGGDLKSLRLCKLIERRVDLPFKGLKDRTLQIKAVKIKMQHGVVSVVLPCLLDGEPLKVRVMPVTGLKAVQEELLHGGEQRALAEAAGTRQDARLIVKRELIDKAGLIDVAQTPLPEKAEAGIGNGQSAPEFIKIQHYATSAVTREYPVESPVDHSFP